MSFTASDEAAKEPGSPGKPAQITDPKALRALAHPARIAILQHLALDGPATATECADVTGLSPSACSYHLRALARYGFVQEESSGATDRRHRPWSAKVVSISVGDDPDRPAAVREAGRLLAEYLQARIGQMRAYYYDRESEYPMDWQVAATFYQDVLHPTPAELMDLKTKIADLVAGYRRLDPAERPEGARRVHAVVEFLPWFRPEVGS